MGKTESQLAALRSGKRRTEPRHCSVLGIEIVWEPLTREQELQATAATCALFEQLGLPKELHSYAELNETLQTEIIARAMRRADAPEVPIAGSGAEVRSLLDRDEIAQLFAQYQDARDTLLPDPFALPERERDEIAAAIKKKDPRLLESFGSCALTSYLLSMGSQPSS